MRILYFVAGFAIGFVLGAWGYKKSLEKDEEDMYNFDWEKKEDDGEKVAGQIIPKTEVEDSPPEDEPEVDEYMDGDYEPIDNDGYKASMRYQRDKNKPPKVLSIEEFANLPPDVEVTILKYYVDNAIFVVKKDNEVIDNDTYFLGDTIDYIAETSEKTIFVMNYALNTCYEVEKVYDQFYV